jgi:pimeloyl-ACP methyl ester esterase
MSFFSHGGVSLRYDRAGTGPPVLFVHGWTGNRTFWTRQVHALRERHTVITVDLRGHGESSRPRTGYGIATLAADLEHLLRALRVPRIALVGWSLGGMVALELARRLGESAHALALVGSTPGGLTDPKNASAVPSERIATMRAEMQADFRAFIRHLAVDAFKDGAASPLHSWAVSEMVKTPPHVVEACFDAILAFDARPWLKTLKVPTAVLHGRHDALLSFASGEVLAQSIPNATLTAFGESGHAPFLEEPDAFTAALQKLLIP